MVRQIWLLLACSFEEENGIPTEARSKLSNCDLQLLSWNGHPAATCSILQNNRNRNCKLRKQDGMLEEKGGNHYSFTAPCAMPL